MVFLVPEDLHSEFLLSLLQLVLCSVAARTSHVHHHSAEYIFCGPLGSLGSVGVSLNIQLRSKLGSVGSVADLHYCTQKDSVKPSLLFSFL